MDNLIIQKAIGHPAASTNLVWFGELPDGQTIAINSSECLLSVDEARQNIELLTKYLEWIGNEQVERYNSWILAEREKERNKPQARPAKKIGTTSIYVMRNARNGLHKIGRSSNPKYREGTLQGDDPQVELLFHFPGSAQDEANLHQQYADKRIRGEWFRLTAEDVETIKRWGGPLK